ncbi:MAG: MlaD family protein [Flavobacteriales bacterium]|nr:MlaD family protein [Flavobacteriales bacterium]MDG1779997.1 MlaD family protein [Flavobacteriales bacterium]MDG2247445.1 MlaD family protein [Flavobacteriales bacterium]
MKGVSKEFKIGTIVVICLVLLVVGITYLKGVNIFAEQKQFHAIYANVDGLGPSNPVVLNGLKIGQVQGVDFHPNGDGSIVVSFSIDKKELNIPGDSKAKIFNSDFFGSKAIDIIMGEEMDYASDGDTLTSDIEMGLAEAVRKELAPLKQKTDQLISGVDDIITNLNAVFDDDATQGLPKAFESLERTLETLEKTTIRLDETVAENKATVGAIFTNVESITKNLSNNNEKLSNIITNFDAISDSLAKVNFAQTIEKADQALLSFAEISEKINNGEGTLSQLINSDSLHTSLLETNKEVQYLINDLYMNPWRYVHVSIFGKKPKEKYSKRELRQLRQMIDEELNSKENEE